MPVRDCGSMRSGLKGANNGGADRDDASLFARRAIDGSAVSAVRL